MIKVAVSGALGKMGRRLVALLAESADMQLAGAIEARGAAGIGKPLKDILPEAPAGVILKDSYAGGSDVVVDFSSHVASAALAAAVVRFRVPIVIGTTGLTADEMKVIDEAAHHVPVLVAPNMSVGANVLFDAAARMAKALGADFDVEIIEAHHRFKKDAPSGTALEAARRIAEARGLSGKNFVYGRQGDTGVRPPDAIAIHAVRAGDIVGDHTILFSCLGERLELKHQAHTRDAFARGALRAARFLVAQEPGKYSMKDVLSANT
jgi:4-hydroxy-tetrahydrodipicolinate reductase